MYQHTPQQRPTRRSIPQVLFHHTLDNVHFIRARGAVVPFNQECYAMRLLAGVLPKRVAYNGPASKKKVEVAVAGSATGTDSAPGVGAGDGAGGDDEDSGDGDGDGDGPRRSSPSSPPSRCSPPRAPLRQTIPQPLIRYAFAWLLALALTLGFVALPALAILAAQLGHPTLASEILHFKPVWLLPVGATASSG